MFFCWHCSSAIGQYIIEYAFDKSSRRKFSTSSRRQSMSNSADIIPIQCIYNHIDIQKMPFNVAGCWVFELRLKRKINVCLPSCMRRTWNIRDTRIAFVINTIRNNNTTPYENVSVRASVGYPCSHIWSLPPDVSSVPIGEFGPWNVSPIN